ncbi:MAG TPA: TonB-dependent receptor, partial [Bacteroidota bacterium]
MSKRVSHILSIVMALVLFIDAEVVAQANVTISGTIRDSQSGDPLPAASVILSGTGFGAASDADGKYVIRNVIAGSYTLRASYVGYKTLETQVEVKEGEDITKDLKLEAVGVQGEVVVVTAQARGQKSAINEQLASQQIVSVVSAARIQELPDANAAEAVGRLPGVAILRSGGEGNAVVVRGLQPKYNAITIDGVRMASSGASDRSADLSMISPYMLEGIKVSKTVTADQDADAIGGTVDFKLKEAGADKEGIGLGVLAQGGYNGLSNAPNKFNNYKYVASIEGRILEDRSLGIFAEADLERRNLTSNEFGASYFHLGNSYTDYITTGLNLRDIPRDRQRANATVVMDYKIPDGKISLLNFGSSGTTRAQNRGEFFNIQTNVHNYTMSDSTGKLGLFTNALSYEQQVSVVHVNAKLSHSFSENKNPNNWLVTFQQASAGLSQFLNVPNLNPRPIPLAANNDTNQTYLTGLTSNSSYSRERSITASMDLETNLNVTDLITTTLKIGGKYRYQSRMHYEDWYSGQGLGLTSAKFIDSLIASHFPSMGQYVNTTSIPILPFLDPNFSYGKFLNGDYRMVMPLNFAMVSEMANYVRGNADLIQQNDAISYFHDLFNSATNNYSGNEVMTAFYGMATINVGPDITVIPGLRYQNLQTTYTASRGRQTTGSATGGGPYDHRDTTLSVSHPYWLPDVMVRYKPLPWFD